LPSFNEKKHEKKVIKSDIKYLWKKEKSLSIKIIYKFVRIKVFHQYKGIITFDQEPYWSPVPPVRLVCTTKVALGPRRKTWLVNNKHFID